MKKFDQLINEYNNQININPTLPKEKQTLQLFQQLKTHRDDLCIFKAKTSNDILKIQYAYIISALNHRHRIWKYDYMSFPRRIGELWESFCKAPFKNASTNIKSFQPPTLDLIKKNLRKKRYPAKIWELIGDVNLHQDVLFSYNRNFYVIDFKSSFQSHEKGNAQRLKTIGILYKMWKPRIKLNILIREEMNNPYLNQLDKFWNIASGLDAYDYIKNYTGINIKKWINHNISFKEHLDPPLHKFLIKQNLTKYLEW